jgi:hypothetical protein
MCPWNVSIIAHNFFSMLWGGLPRQEVVTYNGQAFIASPAFLKIGCASLNLNPETSIPMTDAAK